MRNGFTLFRREFAAYFTSPVGYIFLAAFIAFTNLLGLFVVAPGFFEFPIADLRKYLHVLAGVSAFLVAGVTMRLWAEERKGNTYEMLLTLPMRAHELTLGKFFAAWAFYAVGLALTLTVPLMMILAARPEAGGADLPWYGLLDIGAAVTGYLGALLLGALFISFGLFVSSLCSDQIVAFVLTAPALFIAYFLGLPWVGQATDQALSFLGTGHGAALGRYIGVFTHFDNFARGLLGLGDLLFFVVWTLVFLFLNIFSLERRGRANANAGYAAAVILAFAVGSAANWVFADAALPYWDRTADRQFTVSEVSGRVLAALPEKIRIRYHVTPSDKMPVNLRDLERSVRDKLDALDRASGGKIAYQVIYREVVEEEETTAEPDGETPLDTQLFRKIRPFTIEAMEDGKATAQVIYSALEITYPAADREPDLLPCVMDASQPPSVTGVGELEYRVVSYARKVTQARVPTVALYAPTEPLDPQLMMLYYQMGQQPPPPPDPWQFLPFGLAQLENYEVKRTQLTQSDPLPEDFDLLVVVGPQNLNPRQQYEINLALAKGKPVVLAAQRFRMLYRPTTRALLRDRVDLNPGVGAFLPEGLALGDAMLMAQQGVSLTLPIETALGTMGMPTPAWPMHVELSGDAFTGPADLAAHVPLLRAPWAAPLALDAAKLAEQGLTAQTVLRSNAGAWIKTFPRSRVTEADLKKPDDLPDVRYPLAALVTGQFPMRFTERPAWPEEPPNPMDPRPPQTTPDEPGPVDEYEAKPGTLFIMGDAWTFHQDAIRYPELTYFLNVAAHLTLDADDRAIRELKNKAATLRLMGPLSPAEERLWKMVQVGGAVLLLTVAGLAVALHRQRRRDRYRASLTVE